MPKSKQQKQKEALIRWEKELKNHQVYLKLQTEAKVSDLLTKEEKQNRINLIQANIERKKKQIDDLTVKLNN